MSPGVPEISVDEAARLVTDSEAVLLDVRETHEYVRGRVPGAVHIPLTQLPTLMWRLPRDKKLAVICQHGERSLVAAQYLSTRGFQEVASVAGGTMAWVRSGRQLERG